MLPTIVVFCYISVEGEDFQLLEVMEQLEEDEGGIDLDSTLAPLSQSSRNCEDFSFILY